MPQTLLAIPPTDRRWPPVDWAVRGSSPISFTSGYRPVDDGLHAIGGVEQGF